MTLQEVKDIIDDWFDTEEGREDLEELAQFIESNLNEI